MKPLRPIPLPVPRWTPETEQLIFGDYEDRKGWNRLLIAEMMEFLCLGEQRRLMGPAGLRERVERHYGCTTAPETTSPRST
jgi:hypothetical protein